MAKWQGKRLSVEIYGESHAEKMSVLTCGFPEEAFDEEKLKAFLFRRKAGADIYSTTRTEPDEPVFHTVENGVLAEIYNRNADKSAYRALVGKPRPSHADFAWYMKDGTTDFSGGGRFSGRLTAPFCIAGGIALQHLEKRGIFVGAYVSSVGNIAARSYKDGGLTKEEIEACRQGAFPSLDKQAELLRLIETAKKEGDSLGGTAECVAFGLPAGYGDHLFEGLEGKIASLLYAIPAVKGVEFGDGFSLSAMCGSEANDPLRYMGGKVVTTTNRSGGINGGVSNGMPITLRVAFRPTPSHGKVQKTVDLIAGTDTEIKISGRHDCCIVPRALPCVESAVALAILDEVMQ